MKTRLLTTVLALAAASILVAGCGDDDPATPGTNIPDPVTAYDQTHDWACGTGESCQDVFDIVFTAGTTVDFTAGETTGGSVLQVALYAPDKALGGTNLFTGDATELRCGYVPGCSSNTAGQSVSGFVIPAAGTYRLAVTRDWDTSCGGTGSYRLQISADKDFGTPAQTVDDVASLATDWRCPVEEAMHHDATYGWTCESGDSCQDVFDIPLTAGTSLDVSATETTGGSVLQIALYAPGTALGGANLLTGDTSELRCNFVSGCSNNPDGQTVNGIAIATTGVYRLAVTRDWGNSCGDTGTYRLLLDADQPMGEITQTAEDALSTATGFSCP